MSVFEENSRDFRAVDLIGNRGRLTRQRGRYRVAELFEHPEAA
jgi:hypothetical protein